MMRWECFKSRFEGALSCTSNNLYANLMRPVTFGNQYLLRYSVDLQKKYKSKEFVQLLSKILI
jgi:hypothetical protein